VHCPRSVVRRRSRRRGRRSKKRKRDRSSTGWSLPTILWREWGQVEGEECSIKVLELVVKR